jgi:hypothetical protein
LDLLASAEIYDPATGAWTPTAELSNARFDFTLTTLADGRVLAAAGLASGSGRSSEVYDPATDTWTIAGLLGGARSSHLAALRPDGKVVVVTGSDDVFPTSEVFDPATNAWSPAGSAGTKRNLSTATLLEDGRLLLAAGQILDVGVGTRPSTSALLYRPAQVVPFSTPNFDWVETAPLLTARTFHAATRLADGRILVVGGTNLSGFLASAEIFDPGLAADEAARPAIVSAPAITNAAPAFVAKKLKRLDKCAGAVFACVQVKDGDAGCLAKARTRCHGRRRERPAPRRAERPRRVRHDHHLDRGLRPLSLRPHRGPGRRARAHRRAACRRLPRARRPELARVALPVVAGAPGARPFPVLLFVCRTAALGGHVEQRDACGHLPVPYFHLVFTLPHALNALVRGNRRVLLGLLFRVAAVAA